ncbi:MAG TPA: HU family DNA-binding protein [Bacteroidales bacterium]|nr:HU family DNA-binding protein [Bacteroidales bacterium]
MNKAELIEAMASNSGLTKADSKRALDAFLKATSGALKKGERVALVGFGSFQVAKRAARKAISPQTKKAINIPAKKVVRFKAGNDLAGMVK